MQHHKSINRMSYVNATDPNITQTEFMSPSEGDSRKTVSEDSYTFRSLRCCTKTLTTNEIVKIIALSSPVIETLTSSFRHIDAEG